MHNESTIGRRPAGTMRVVAAAALLLLLAGCGQEPTATERIEQAKQHRSDGDSRSAVIELRNALQDEPENAEARALLGRIQFELEDMASAEKELRRALDLGVPEQTLIVELGSALLRQGSPDELLETVGVDDAWPDPVRANAHALRARAYIAVDETRQARLELERAAELDSDVLHHHLGRIELALAQDSVDEAHRWWQQAAEAHADAVMVWRLGVQVALVRNEPQAAEDAADRAVELAGNPAEDLLLRARLRVARGNLEGAREDLETLGSDRAEHPRVRFVKGLIAWSEQDFEAACTELQEAVSDAPEFAEARFYLGACQFRSGELNQAESHLRWVHERAPSPEAARLLGTVQLALDQPEQARATLSPVVQQYPDDATALALLGRAEMALGNTTEAIDYLHRLSRLRPDDADVKLQLGAGLLRAGQLGAGKEAFGEALALDPEFERAGAMLVISHLQAGELDQALEKSREMTEAQPDSTLPWTLTGLVHAVRDDEAAAREALGRAVEIAPGDPAARHFLARLDRRDGNVDGARTNYEAVLEQHPEHTGTLVALASLEANEGNGERAGDLLLRAHESDPDATGPRVLLGRHRLSRGDPAGALAIVSRPDGGVPREGPILEIAGRAHLAMDQPASAIDTFRQWAEIDPEAQGVHLLMAQAYTVAGDGRAAVEQIEKELERNPDNLQAQMVMARARMLQGRDEEARELLAALPDEVAGEAHVLETRAALALRAGEPERAAEYYRRIMESEPSSSAVVRLGSALRRSGDTDGAKRVLEVWLEEHPGDVGVRLAAADLYLLQEREQQAISAYREVLEHAPESVQALNNLAWLLRTGEPEEALEFAERAVELQPDNPTIIDTLGMVLLEQGRVDEALVRFRAALDRAPDAPDLRYHFARGLAAAGRSTEAREQVRRALDSDATFAERADARVFLEELEGGS